MPSKGFDLLRSSSVSCHFRSCAASRGLSTRVCEADCEGVVVALLRAA
jgi:hypothetical protein